jgi:hypothetical protein
VGISWGGWLTDGAAEQKAADQSWIDAIATSAIRVTVAVEQA